MKTTRRMATGLIAAAAMAPAVRVQGAAAVQTGKTYDVAVIGAGTFGAWTAHAFSQRGLKVVLLDAYGPANSRASSGDESRITRSSYGQQAIYSRWARESLADWKALQARTGVHLFEPTGVLAFSTTRTSYLADTAKVLADLAIPHERLTANEVMRRFPAFHLDQDEGALFEPESGALFARHAIQTLVDELVRHGVDYRTARIAMPTGKGALPAITAQDGSTIAAGRFVFACGPWFAKLFPDLLGKSIEAQRAEVFYLGIPAGSTAYDPAVMPTWMDQWGIDGAYGFPNLETRGCKVAVDGTPEVVDPETQSRTVTQPYIDAMRTFVKFRLPGLANAPIVETRVCQYEVAPREDYILDRHPDFANVWIAGGGSGHGFKNGPRVGRYMADLVLGGGKTDERFAIGPR